MSYHKNNTFLNTIFQVSVNGPLIVSMKWYRMIECDVIQSLLSELASMYLFLYLHLLITSDLLFSMLSFPCRAIISFSLRHRLHSFELWLYDLRVPKICQDISEVLFADIIFQYLLDSSVSVWYLMLLNVFLCFVFLSLNALSLTSE